MNGQRCLALLAVDRILENDGSKHIPRLTELDWAGISYLCDHQTLHASALELCHRLIISTTKFSFSATLQFWPHANIKVNSDGNPRKAWFTLHRRIDGIRYRVMPRFQTTSLALPIYRLTPPSTSNCAIRVLMILVCHATVVPILLRPF